MATLRDNIADAEDGFPPSIGSSVTSTTSVLDTFTTEADDPTEIGDWSGEGLGFTAWVKLVVPSEALTSIEVVSTTDVTDTVIWLYDEVPTASSTFIYQDDDDNFLLGPNGLWSRLVDLTLPAGTYYLCVTPYNGATWEGEGGNVSVQITWSLLPTISDFSLDSLLKRTWLAPAQPSATNITPIDSATGSVDDDDTLTLTIPVSVADGDLVVATISWDSEDDGNIEMLIPAMGDWSYSNTIQLDNNDHALSVFSTIWHTGDATDIDFQTVNLSGAVATAKAGALSILRGGISLSYLEEFKNETPTAGSKITPPHSVSPTDDLYLEILSYLGVVAGGAAGSTTWLDLNIPSTPHSLLFTVSATDYASATALFWSEPHDHILERYLDPQNVDFYLAGLFLVSAPTPEIPLAAVIRAGGLISLAAYIQAATHTTHLRTGPHFGEHPDTAIVTSATLGGNSPGTDLHTILSDLDALITDLENQS